MDVDTELHPDVALEFAFDWPFSAPRQGLRKRLNSRELLDH
jgi:hypothetical protein